MMEKRGKDVEWLAKEGNQVWYLASSQNRKVDSHVGENSSFRTIFNIYEK